MKQLVLFSLTIGLALMIAACGQESGTTARETGASKESGAAKETTMAPKDTAPKDSGVINQERAASAKTTPSAARETGTTRTDVNLMAEPYSDSRQAAQLPSNTSVDILERRGGWLRISANGKTGWAKLFQVRTGTGLDAGKSGEGVAILRNIGETGRSGSQGIVATTGIRGLSAADLKTAKPNPKAVDSMDAYRATDNTARQYAQSAELKEKNIPFLSQ